MHAEIQKPLLIDTFLACAYFALFIAVSMFSLDLGLGVNAVEYRHLGRVRSVLLTAAHCLAVVLQSHEHSSSRCICY